MIMVTRNFLALLLIAITEFMVNSSPISMDIVWLNESWQDNLAVCNDGSPSAFFLKRFTNESLSNTWLFFLQGGGQCYSKKSCATRIPSLMSSHGYSSVLSGMGGIFDDDISKSSFWGANKVYVPYCTSDGWIGDAAPSPLTWGYHFRGQRVVRSALSTLITRNDITSSSQIMFGGGSAGARGMMNNVDFLVPLLPPGCKVLGAFLDSPYTIDIEPYDSTFVGFQYETEEIYNRYNVTAIIPTDCALVYPADAGEGWKCLFGQYRIPFVKTRYLLVASQYDSYQLTYDTGLVPGDASYSDPGANEYAGKWSAQTQQLLIELASGSSSGWVHSWACYNHDVSESSRYYSLTAMGTSLSDAMRLFQDSNSANGTMAWIEQCSGLFCGADCDGKE